MDCYIGLDIGTSAVKGAMLSDNGETLSRAQAEFHYLEKDSGKLMNPGEFISACFSVIKALAAERGEYHIAAVCPCCASGNLLFLGKDYKPITHIIGWQSSVDEAEAQSYYSNQERAEVYQTVGWQARNSFPIAVLPWIFRHKRDIISSAGMICMSAEYLNFVLTGCWGISQSMGTPFYMLDQEKGCYCKSLLERFEIGEERLPPIMDKGSIVGYVLPDIEALSGLPAGTPVVLGSFDHPSCATGAGVFETGEMLLSCGTSWVEFFPIENRSTAIKADMLVDRYMLHSTPYCAMSSLTSLSLKIDAMRKKLLGDITHAEFDELAEQSCPGAEGAEIDLCSGKVSIPHDDRHHIARAIIESAARLLADRLESARRQGMRADRITMAGGITNSAVCVKIIAETIGQDIRVVNGVSAGACGAAMLAGIGAGRFDDEYDAFNKMNFLQTEYSALN